MFSLFKEKWPAHEVAELLFSRLKDHAKKGQVDKPFIDEATEKNIDTMREEWLYFEAFQIDYFVFLALDKTAQKDAVLGRFWSDTKVWLSSVESPPHAQRLGPYAGDIKVFEPEIAKPMLARLSRRLESYRDALTHPQGPNHGLALTFSILCNELDISFVLGIAQYVHVKKLDFVRIFRSYRITL